MRIRKPKHSPNPNHLAKSLFLNAAICCVILQSHAAAQKPTIIKLQKILDGKQACATTGIQFISETEVLLLVGPGSNCYRSVNDLELVVISTDGRLVARKAWPSTYPVVVFRPSLVALAEIGHILVLDDHLQPVTTLAVPDSSKQAIIFLATDGLGNLFAREPRGKNFEYSGDPLHLVETETSHTGPSTLFTFPDGREVTQADSKLLISVPDGAPRTLADISWVEGCKGLCQSYDAGFSRRIAVGKKKRMLFIANGSKFPVTDAAGLFPYFRVAVFDLDSGAEVYRRQYITQTSNRSAGISPDGDRIALLDHDQIRVESLP